MGELILFFVLKGLLVDLFPVCLQLAIGSFGLSKKERKNADDFLPGRQNNGGKKFLTLKTLTWQLEEWTCSMYSPCSLVVNVSTWIRKGTPFSPPCFLGVNSVLMQLT